MKILSLLISFIMIVGCKSNSSSDEVVRLVIYGQRQPYLFIMNSSDELIVSTGPMNFNFEMLEFTDEIEQYEKVKLNSKDKTSICQLIDSVKTSTSNINENQIYTDVNKIQALINCQKYSSIYVTSIDGTSIDSQYLNKELLELTYKLIDLSPFNLTQ